MCWSVFINKVVGSVGSFIKKKTLTHGIAFSRSVICLEINLSPYVIDMILVTFRSVVGEVFNTAGSFLKRLKGTKKCQKRLKCCLSMFFVFYIHLTIICHFALLFAHSYNTYLKRSLSNFWRYIVFFSTIQDGFFEGSFSWVRVELPLSPSSFIF